MSYIARINHKGDKQELKDHLSNVSDLCSKFTTELFGDPEIGEYLGMLHDLGKYKDAFQTKINTGSTDNVDHSLGGALLIESVAKKANLIRTLEYPIAGHHAGLADWGVANSTESTLMKRLKKDKTYDNKVFAEFFSENKLPAAPIDTVLYPHLKYRTSESKQLFIRMLFSCLVDADRLDALHCDDPSVNPEYKSIKELQDDLNDFLAKAHFKPSPINNIRTEIRKEALKKSNLKTGIFTFCSPTGSGKTISSISFALNHALKNNHKRIIYGLPFISIIEQTAAQFKDLFGADNVLEVHHAYMGKNSDEYLLSSTNFDAPLVVTTNVQIFNALFSNKPGQVRKLHNLANSIIILDEAQSIPVKYLRPCMKALELLSKEYNCTVVLCSATLHDYKKEKLIKSKITPIIKNPQDLINKLRRARTHYLGYKTVHSIATEIRKHEQALCIVNTKKHALELYNALSGVTNLYHLSTNMYVEHRMEIIKKIREHLDKGEPCVVISTQLIEAGVDISFPHVYRSLSGVDSVLQARGRCNRNGEIPTGGDFYIFLPTDFKHEGFADLKTFYDTANELMSVQIRKKLEIDELDFVEKYFNTLVKKREAIDKETYKLLFQAKNAAQYKFNFKSISDEYQYIETLGESVIVNDNPVISGLLDKYEKYGYYSLSKTERTMLSNHSVNITDRDLQKIAKSGGIYILNDFIILKDTYYNVNTGVII